MRKGGISASLRFHSWQCFAVLLSLCFHPTPSTAAETRQYNCFVAKFVPSGDDTTFAEKNAKKQFDLLVKSDEILTFVRSKEFRDSENRYTIISRDMFDTFAISTENSGYGALVMPTNAGERLERDGYFDSTVSTQGTFYINTWILRCTG